MDKQADTLRIFLENEAAADALAERWAPHLQAPLTVWLGGDLGAGKTTLVRALLLRLGHQGAVKSPTYALVESYRVGGTDIHHFDLYRFTSPEEWEDAGLDDLFEQPGLRFIEWPQNGGGFTPPPDVQVALSVQDGGRLCTLTALTDNGRQSLAI